MRLTSSLLLILVLWGCSGGGPRRDPERDAAVDSGAQAVDSGTDPDAGGVLADSGLYDAALDAAVEDRWPDRDLTQLTLHGTLPAARLPAPEFVATAFDGTQRTRDDLIGQPTVMWFFPAAFTGG